MTEEPDATPSRRGRELGRVRFRALRPQIEAELAAGHSVVAVHERYKDRLRLGYEMFARYVRNEIKGLGGPPVVPPRMPTGPAQMSPAPVRPPPRTTGFQWDAEGKHDADLV